jgi:hypothetical protein
MNEREDNLENWFTRAVHPAADLKQCVILGPAMIVVLHGKWLLRTPSRSDVEIGPMSGRFYLPDRCSLQVRSNNCVCSGFRLAPTHHDGRPGGPQWPL